MRELRVILIAFDPVVPRCLMLVINVDDRGHWLHNSSKLFVFNPLISIDVQSSDHCDYFRFGSVIT